MRVLLDTATRFLYVKSGDEAFTTSAIFPVDGGGFRMIRSVLKYALRRIGFDVRRRSSAHGDNFFRDFRELSNSPNPVILDVGANRGGFARKILGATPDARIFCVEPDPLISKELKEAMRGLANVAIIPKALADSRKARTFNRNEVDDMSSFLELDPTVGWGRVTDRQIIETETVDALLETLKIDTVDLLKIDTQGFDLAVLRGAESHLSKGKIRYIYVEAIFSSMYANQARPWEIMSFLEKKSFELLGIYGINYISGKIGWCDLFFGLRPGQGQSPLP